MFFCNRALCRLFRPTPPVHGLPLLLERLQALDVVGAVVDDAPQALHALEALRAHRMRNYGIPVTYPSLGARDIALGFASPLAGRDDAAEAAADCVQKRVVAERAELR